MWFDGVCSLFHLSYFIDLPVHPPIFWLHVVHSYWILSICKMTKMPIGYLPLWHDLRCWQTFPLCLDLLPSFIVVMDYRSGQSILSFYQWKNQVATNREREREKRKEKKKQCFSCFDLCLASNHSNDYMIIMIDEEMSLKTCRNLSNHCFWAFLNQFNGFQSTCSAESHGEVQEP